MGDQPGIRKRLRVIIFGVDTPRGRFFDVVLLYAILISVVGVLLESVNDFQVRYGTILDLLEWGFTILFTIEYAARIWVAEHRFRYMRSFFGIIDLISIVPEYLGLFHVGAGSLLVIRTLRLLRVFRILKLSRYVSGSNELLSAMRASREKITVFFFFVITTTVIMGTLMYIIEGSQEDSAFTSIPKSIYWAIVTLTTVGYGDLSPETPLGQAFSSVLMVIGYAIIAVPTGIVSAEIARHSARKGVPLHECKGCGRGRHDPDARYCKQCGEEL